MELFDNSEVVIVSDGVVGSNEENSLKIEDLDNVLKGSKTAQIAAEELTSIAKKEDDKTAIVLRIES